MMVATAAAALAHQFTLQPHERKKTASNKRERRKKQSNTGKKNIENNNIKAPIELRFYISTTAIQFGYILILVRWARMYAARYKLHPAMWYGEREQEKDGNISKQLCCIVKICTFYAYSLRCDCNVIVAFCLHPIKMYANMFIKI